jgi:8-oxo-dGTP pyrophosphatase MutT (NUDIX family)
MSPPTVPAPAATLVLLRDRAGGGVEVLLIQRHAGSRFAAGDHVFAGGRIEPDELPAGAERLCRGLTAAAAAERLGGDRPPREALGYWVGAVREAFEEVGILLACGPDGAWVDPEQRARLAAEREACRRDHRRFLALVGTEGLALATDRMAYVAHWITPEESPIRFDTRFFAAVAPPGQEPAIDGQEIVAARWIAPAEAAAAARRREITLRLPTLKTLELLEGAPSAAAALAGAGGRPVPTIRPRIITVEGRPQAVIPPDPRWY